MEKCLNYNITNVEYMKTRGAGLAEIVKDWLGENGIDALAYDFVLGDNASFIIDYNFDENVSENKIKGLVEQIFERFNIPYELEKIEE